MYQPSYTIQPPQPSVYAFQPQPQVVMPPPIVQMNPIQSYPVVMQQPMTSTIMQNPIVGPNSTLMTCSSCRASIRTTVSHQASDKTHMTALVLCIFGLCPCALIPYCSESCQKATHTCPNCNAFLGSYNN